MNTATIVFILMLLLVLGAFFLLTEAQVDSQKAAITSAIREVGGKPISIARRFLSGDRSNHIFDVVYKDSEGTVRSTSCKMLIGVFTVPKDIFWEEAPR